MFLVVGLGNPGREHEGNRHNVGFAVADALHRAIGGPGFQPKFSGVWARGELGGVQVSVLKPQTFMNRSGDSVQPAAAFLKLPPESIVVVHDELDLSWREVRLKSGGGHAGHNGVRSIIERLGTPDFVRVRVGIGKVAALTRRHETVAALTRRPETVAALTRRPETVAALTRRPETIRWVLSDFDVVERAELPDVIEAAVSAVRSVVVGEFPRRGL